MTTTWVCSSLDFTKFGRCNWGRNSSPDHAIRIPPPLRHSRFRVRRMRSGRPSALQQRSLNSLRQGWLNPPGISAAELRKRTLTNLYNQRPTWLDNAHARLDTTVADAYGWAADLPDTGILEHLLALNLERAKAEATTQ